MAGEIRKTVSLGKLIDDIHLVEPFPIRGEHAVILKLIRHIGQCPATSMQGFLTNHPFPFKVILHMIPCRIKNGDPVSVFYPQVQVREIPIWPGIIAFPPYREDTVDIGHVCPMIQIITIGFPIIRNIGEIRVPKGIVVGHGDDLSDRRRGVSVRQRRIQIVIMIERDIGYGSLVKGNVDLIGRTYDN